MKKNNQFDLTFLFLIIFFISFIFFSVFKLHTENVLNTYTEGFSKVEQLSSDIQRLTKLELEENYNQDFKNQLKLQIDDVFLKIFDIAPDGKLIFKYFNTQEQIKIQFTKFIDNMILFRTAVSNFNNGIDGSREVLLDISESNYEYSKNLLSDINILIESQENFIKLLSSCIFFNISIILTLLLKKLKTINAELVKTKELSKDIYIDASTGLYNRARCQELLNNFIEPEKTRERAIIVFDLNFLKRTNDMLGHRTGDLLISSFAEQLKEATKIFPFEIFIARYGGDEFIVYFSSVKEKDVNIYIKELNFLVDKFNEQEKNVFEISYAVGYAITTKNSKHITMQQLFDIADENMYKNKIEIKNKINKN